jgi:3-methyladenine DNA glycosylase AlkD
MTAADIIKEMEPLGTETYRKVLRNHGVPEPFFGVKIEDMKKIQKRVKKNYQLALDLYDSGIYDAMYLAGLIADDAMMTKKDLQKWAKNAHCPVIAEYTVAWVAAESNHGAELAREWIDSDNENIAAAGWSTFSSLVGIKDDADLNIPELKKLLQRVQKGIHTQPNRVRYVMNGFVIAVGGYVKDLTEAALKTAEKIGEVTVEMGGTACKVPGATGYIEKMQSKGVIGKKRKTAKC